MNQEDPVFSSFEDEPLAATKGSTKKDLPENDLGGRYMEYLLGLERHDPDALNEGVVKGY
jgi:predicted trehalose synthase